MGELQEMTGHGFMHGQIATHVVVVFPEEGLLPLRRPIFWGRLDRKEGFAVLLERAGRVAIGDAAAALKLGHDNDVERLVRNGHEIVLLGEVCRFPHNFLGVTNDGIVIRMLLG